MGRLDAGDGFASVSRREAAWVSFDEASELYKGASRLTERSDE